MLAGHMWQDMLHNEVHDGFDTFGVKRSQLVLRLVLGSELGLRPLECPMQLAIVTCIRACMQMLKVRPYASNNC